MDTWRLLVPCSGDVLHYPDPAGTLKYVHIQGNLSQFLPLSTIHNAVKSKAGICLATVFDAQHFGVMHDQ